jgi:hypothetical protein
MECRRCGGYLVSDRFMELVEVDDRTWHHSCRCVNCGAIEDSVIRSNRRLQMANTITPRRDNRGLRNIPTRGHQR